MKKSPEGSSSNNGAAASRLVYVKRSGGLGLLPRRDFLKLGAGVTGAALLAACFPSSVSTPSASPSAGPSGILNIALASLGTERWVNRFNNMNERWLWGHIGDPVFGVSRKDGVSFDRTEGLMDSFELQDNGATVIFTMKIKKGIPFHYDEGFATAADVKFAWVQISLPDATNSDAGNLRSIINNDPDNIQVVDDQTLRLTLKREWAQPLIEYRFSNGVGGQMDGAVPQAYVGRVGDTGFQAKPVSTGPFRFVEHLPGQRVTIEAVPNHWRKTSAYQTVNFLKVPDASTRLSMLLSGQVDIIQLDGQQVETALSQGGDRVRVKSQPSGGTVWYLLPTVVRGATALHPDLYDANVPWLGSEPDAAGPTMVRRAMSLAIDRAAITKAVLRGYGSPGVLGQGSWATPGASWYNPRWQPKPFQPDEARRLMQQAGFPNGFEMDVLIYQVSGVRTDLVMTAVAGYWEKELKLKINLKQEEYNPGVRNRMIARTLGRAAAPRASSFSIPGTGITRTMGTAAGFGYVETAAVDAIIKKHQGELTSAQLDAFTREVGDYIYDQEYVTGVVSSDFIYGLNTRKIADWNRHPGQSWVGGLEWITKP